MRIANVFGLLLLKLFGIKRKDNYPSIDVIDNSSFHDPMYPTANMSLTQSHSGHVFTCVAQSLETTGQLVLTLMAKTAGNGKKVFQIGPVTVRKGKPVRIRKKVPLEGDVIYASITAFEVSSRKPEAQSAPR